MYPYHPHSSWSGHAPHMQYYRGGRGPSRIVWFILGGLATAWWLRAKDMKREARAIEGAAPSGSCHERRWGWGWNSSQNEHGQNRNEAQWEAEREKIRKFGNEAGETIIDVTEASLDSVLSAVDTLKKKLAEQRAERERAKQSLPKDDDPPHRI
ncbi:hypothetical protein BOTBODRAFT_31775 [Botryobasidium botryosum FD-172 SS1]|uniref:Uncharacterized protein n=1 Tax=Botryobasidium botryosum (strain FD-172 SS1) TaxID=930990 RepID=A0A067MIU3_BOTB1|nr:hypothetical protein BOTBODRAFT_31775 [Botryobasidium botryosum FD-172 SS1]